MKLFFAAPASFFSAAADSRRAGFFPSRGRVLATVSGTIARSRGTDDEDLPRRLDDFGSHARRALLV
jgi:hypothetical protein